MLEVLLMLFSKQSLSDLQTKFSNSLDLGSTRFGGGAREFFYFILIITYECFNKVDKNQLHKPNRECLGRGKV